jgi:hypothetical protein
MNENFEKFHAHSIQVSDEEKILKVTSFTNVTPAAEFETRIRTWVLNTTYNSSTLWNGGFLFTGTGEEVH